jgi:hypothetical protein
MSLRGEAALLISYYIYFSFYIFLRSAQKYIKTKINVINRKMSVRAEGANDGKRRLSLIESGRNVE